MNEQLLVGLKQYIDQQIQEIRILESKNELTVVKILSYINIISAICTIASIPIPNTINAIIFGSDPIDESADINICIALVDLSYEIDKIEESYV